MKTITIDGVTREIDVISPAWLSLIHYGLKYGWSDAMSEYTTEEYLQALEDIIPLKF